MDTERDEAAARSIHFLMRVLTNLNAGAMLALCLWLAFAAMDSQSSSELSRDALRFHGCDCVLHQVTDWAGRTDIASNN